jgi:hypothetical protein
MKIADNLIFYYILSDKKYGSNSSNGYKSQNCTQTSQTTLLLTNH